MTRSELQNIPGVGEKTINRLLRKFGSVDAIRNASEEDIAVETGKVRAEAIMIYLGRE